MTKSKFKTPKYCLWDFGAWESSQDVLAMNWAQQGVYFRLLGIAWGSSSCSIPNDSKKIAAMLHMTEAEWVESYAEAILPAWVEAESDPTRLVQERLFATWKEGIEASERLREQGKAGAKARYSNGSSHDKPSHSQAIAHPKPGYSPAIANNITQHHKTQDNHPPPPPSSGSDRDRKKNAEASDSGLTPDGLFGDDNPVAATDRFSEFWNEYPKRVAKPDAERAYRKAVARGTGHDQIVSGLRRWKMTDQWTRDSGKFIPHPATWLNRQGWADDVPSNNSSSGPKRLDDIRPEEY